MVAGGLDRLHDHAERRIGRGEVRRKPALVADIGVVPGIGELLAQSVEDFGADANRLGARGRADRHHHEFLDVDRVVGVHAAIDDVHHRHRQGAGEDAADIAVERHAGLGRRGLRAGEADPEDRIGAEPGLVRGAVELDQHAVDGQLVLGVEAGQRVEDLAIHRFDRLPHPPAAKPRPAVALLDRLVRAGRGAGRNRRAADHPALQGHLDLDGRIAAAVEDLAGMNVGDRGHVLLLNRRARAGCALARRSKAIKFSSNRRQRPQRHHRRTLAGGVVRVLVRLDEDGGDADRRGGAREDRRKFALTARPVAEAARLRHGMGRVEHDRVAGLRHDRQRAHVDDQRVVAEARAALAQQDLLVAGRGDLCGDVLHVPRRQELALFDVDRLAGRARRQQQIGLAAEKSRDLQDIDDFGHRRALFAFVHIGQHRQPGRLAHFGEDRQPRFRARCRAPTASDERFALSNEVL